MGHFVGFPNTILSVWRGNQHGGRGNVDLHNMFDMMSHESRLLPTYYIRDGFKTQPEVDQRFRPAPGSFCCSKQ